MTLVYITAAWCAGLWLAHQAWSLGVLGCDAPGWILAAPAAGAAVLAVLFRRRATIRWTMALLAFVLLGAWRYQAQPFAACVSASDLAFYNGSAESPVRVTIEGVITGYPDVRDTRTFYRVRVETLTIGAQARSVRGEALVQASRFPAHAYGDRIRASGALETPPRFDDFDYAAYLSTRGIRSLLRRARVELIAHDAGSLFWRILYELRERGSDLLNRALPEPAAALANGMLLGIESGIPPPVDEAFKATGTSHVIIISGSNIALLTGVLMGLLARILGKGRAPLPVAAVVVLYVLLVGADPAAVRAGIMGVLYVVAIALGRISTAYVSLCFSALLMTLLNPLALWDIGFQLSFAATLGLILFTPAIQVRFERFLARRFSEERTGQIMGVLNSALIVTLAAQVLTLPLLIYYFGRLSLISLVANFLILPAQPPIMMGGMLTLVIGLIWETLGRVVAVVPWFFLTYTVAVVRVLAGAPLASVETGAPGRMLAVLYGAALAGGLIVRHWPGLRRMLPMPQQAGRWLAAAGLSAAVMVTVVNLLPDGRLHLTFVASAEGEAVLVTTPQGRRAWVWDGRGDGAALAAAARAALPGGAQRASLAIGPGADDHWPAAHALTADAIPSDTVIRLDDKVELVRLPASDGWLLRYGKFDTFLPATISREAQIRLADAWTGHSITLLKTPGAGSGAWPLKDFLVALSPQVILWPSDTTYPPDVIEWLQQHRTTHIPEESIVEVISDGKQLWLQRWSTTGKQ